MSIKLGALAGVGADVDAPARMVVIHPDSQKVLLDSSGAECFIEFLSPDSEVGRKLDRARGVAAMRRARSGRNRVDDDEDPVDIQIDTLTALATAWNFGPDADAFSADAARSLFSDPAFAWLRKQAYVFVYAEANFIKRSSKK